MDGKYERGDFMIKKSKRTKDKYVKAAAELDMLCDCLISMENTTALLPAKEIDYLYDVLNNKVSQLKVILENQFVKDFGGTLKHEEGHLYSIYFNPSCKLIAEEYKSRYDEMKNLIFGKIDRLNAKPREMQPAPKWISVKERLPEAVEKNVDGKITFSDFVLVYLVCDDGFTYITNDKCIVDSKLWLHEIPDKDCKVTHWMPLPEPPKGDDAED